jgi:hypothetical protein
MTTPNLYIDEYDSPVPTLQGCENDILAFQTSLEGRVASDRYLVHAHTLLNREATRQAVIEGFRQHLGQARAGDIALFYYAGHGGQEKTPPELWHLEPDRLNETLVCHDSRAIGSRDLSDKEIAKLLREIARNHPQIIVILDCCHSGSATRGELNIETAVRKAPLDPRDRPLNSYLFSLEEAQLLTVPRQESTHQTPQFVGNESSIITSICLQTLRFPFFSSNSK